MALHPPMVFSVVIYKVKASTTVTFAYHAAQLHVVQNYFSPHSLAAEYLQKGKKFFKFFKGVFEDSIDKTRILTAVSTKHDKKFQFL